MTSSVVSLQGFTYEITCVSLENCLTSGVHLSAIATQALIGASAFVCNKRRQKAGEGPLCGVGFADLDRSTPGYAARSR